MLTLLRRLLRPLRSAFRQDFHVFQGSQSYWDRRYRVGGNSGLGSYGELALFKAEVLNDFVAREEIRSVIEFGCGDGHQLTLAQYPRYLGFDVSAVAVQMCQTLFAGDTAKEFKSIEEYNRETADAALSLDVIYHLVEDQVFYKYMETLFNSASKWVVVYSSNFDGVDDDPDARHVRHRQFVNWISVNRPDWSCIRVVKNRFPFQGDYKTGSHADFFFFRKHDGVPDGHS